MLVLPVNGSALDLGLVVAALLFGLRHGVDWDHIAAITDIAATQDSPRRGLWYGTIYAIGHAGVVFALGVGAIVLGSRLPGWVDEAMSRVVGATLLLLGAYVVVSLIRHGRDFRLQSRWMLIIRGVRRAGRYLVSLRKGSGQLVDHEHGHVAIEGLHHGADDPDLPVNGSIHTHAHQHRPQESYGVGTSLTVGALHGVGAETPTQVLVFLTAAGAGGTATGLIILFAFLVGLLAANTLITLSAAFGFVSATRHPRVYVTLGAATAVVSLTLGVFYIAGLGSFLPHLLGG